MATPRSILTYDDNRPSETITFTEEVVWRMIHSMCCDKPPALIEYVVDVVADAVRAGMSDLHEDRKNHRLHSLGRWNLRTVLKNGFHNARVRWPVMLVSLIYIERVKTSLEVTDPVSAYTTMYLGALIVASKYCDDSTLRNVDWARCTGLRSLPVNSVEVEFLSALKFMLRVTNDEVASMMYRVFDACFPPTFASTPLFCARLRPL